MPLPTNVSSLSPMMKQYVAMKAQHPDEILFYRLGDFYEMFFDDAITASKELELVLTGKDCGLEERAPMCGIPFHSYEGYLAKLVKKGYKVAICEQMEDPALAKGIVKRDIIRIVTPGTVTDSSILNEASNNYIAALFMSDDGFGLALCDISTGSVEMTEAQADIETIKSELSRFEPKEIVMNEQANLNGELTKFIDRSTDANREMLYASYFNTDVTQENILKHFEPAELKKAVRLKLGYGLKALGALIKYLGETQLSGINRLVKLNVYKCTKYMFIPPQSKRNLELVRTMRNGERRGSLLWVMDRTETSMGRRLLKNWLEKPLMDCDDINSRLDAVQELVENPVALSQVKESLEGMFDIERMLTRVLYRSCVPRDFIALAQSSRKLAQLKETSKVFKSSLMHELNEKIDSYEDIQRRIAKTIVDDPPALLKDGGYIRTGFSADIDELKELLHDSKTVLSRLEKRLKEQTGINNLKVGYNKIFGYYIEVSNSGLSMVPPDFIRKQTLTTGERFITQELKELEERILGASGKLDVLERTAFEELRVEIENNLKRIQGSVDAAAAIDVLCGFAFLASDNNYCRPVINDSGVIRLSASRHPVVERVLSDSLFVSNDVYLDTKDNLLALITGPNMAGKSTYMRQTALIVIMAQMGSFVPARQAEIGVVDAVFTRIGASDDIFAGDSTFMVEMKEVAQILSKATHKSLVILDEIGRGTSTYDGMSIARAVIEFICKDKGLGAKTMFATHYHELTTIDSDFKNVKNYNVSAKKRDDDIVFLRRIIHGPSDDSYGIEVAKLAGLPEEIISRAKTVLEGIEIKSGYLPPIVKNDEKAYSGAERVMALLATLDVETLTPIEAMVKLNELATIFKQERNNGDYQTT